MLLWATEAPGDKAAPEAEPVYETLEAVREGRLVFTDELTAGAIYFASPASLPHLLDQLVPALAGEGPAAITSDGGG